MSLPSINEIQSLNINELENEILNIKKELFKLRFYRGNKQVFKSHQIKHQKHRLAQLLMIRQNS
uniref:ribosomal protein L29 n=1 Tax=Silvetia siliquosa TaxID=93837 RepID=UPI001FA80BD5|nr:ribosomal protein L29 [Silvetia siliquosa]UNH90272.1 ribosomal protein L29 [Silvetia siliquosa]